MIPKKTLRELIKQKLKDADVLVLNRRYLTGFYIAGYALEIAFKLKICKIFKFTEGFPENKFDFGIYQNSYKQQTLLANTLIKIKDIRNHDLNKLLFYSGVEYQIKLNHLAEWNLAVGWNPEVRYKLQRVLKKEAVDKVNAVKILVQAIL